MMLSIQLQPKNTNHLTKKKEKKRKKKEIHEEQENLTT
jgi:hypothetical protein